MAGGWLDATAALYADVFRRGAVLALRNWAVGLIVLLYLAILTGVAVATAPFGIAGGLVQYLAQAACFSSGLSLVEQAIRSRRVTLADIPASFTAYLGDVMTVLFFLWLGSLALSMVLPTLPLPVLLLVWLAAFVFLNAVPELIYLGRHPAAEILVESYRFIGENWIEWFPPNVVLAVMLYGVASLPAGPFGLAGTVLFGVALYFAMIVRGLLFLELASSSRRARAFRRRAAG